MNIDELKEKAKEIRRLSLKMIANANSGHPGGSLSAADIYSSLYFYKMKHDSKNPTDSNRDRLILSKGHCCPGMYAALAMSGYFPMDELMTFRLIGTRLQGHPHINQELGFENSGGPLGQGLSQAVGHALSGKIDKKDFTTYCLLGDGEMQEGQVWEAVMAAGHFKLNKLVAIVDDNKYQIDGATAVIMNIEPVGEKFSSFGWHVIKCNGHEISEINKALDDASEVKDKPVAIIADTIKGKGVSFMEGTEKWHGKAPNEEELALALKELE